MSTGTSTVNGWGVATFGLTKLACAPYHLELARKVISGRTGRIGFLVFDYFWQCSIYILPLYLSCTVRSLIFNFLSIVGGISGVWRFRQIERRWPCPRCFAWRICPKWRKVVEKCDEECETGQYRGFRRLFWVLEYCFWRQKNYTQERKERPGTSGWVCILSRSTAYERQEGRWERYCPPSSEKYKGAKESRKLKLWRDAAQRSALWHNGKRRDNSNRENEASYPHQAIPSTTPKRPLRSSGKRILCDCLRNNKNNQKWRQTTLSGAQMHLLQRHSCR